MSSGHARPHDRGIFITLEGGEGSGKSTQAQVLAGHLRDNGYIVCLTEEPMGTPLGRAVKELFERQAETGDVLAEGYAELFLFEAARAQHVRDVIRPALERGEIVVCDRFADSTTAYQGYGRGLNLREVETCNQIATGGLEPDLTMLLDIDPETGLTRAEQASNTSHHLRRERDSIGQESLAFHKLVRDGFLAIAEAHPNRVSVIDASVPQEAVSDAVWRAVSARISS
jgi:dTMP kinase